MPRRQKCWSSQYTVEVLATNWSIIGRENVRLLQKKKMIEKNDLRQLESNQLLATPDSDIVTAFCNGDEYVSGGSALARWSFVWVQNVLILWIYETSDLKNWPKIGQLDSNQLSRNHCISGKLPQPHGRRMLHQDGSALARRSFVQVQKVLIWLKLMEKKLLLSDV